MSKLEANMASISLELVGFMMALVIPDAIAMGRNVALIACLFGNPNDIFEAVYGIMNESNPKEFPLQ